MFCFLTLTVPIESLTLRTITLLFSISFFCGISQALPPIQNFTPIDYNGENQNWAITQGIDAHIYIANNHNLIEYDGVRWSNYKSPNASIFRAIKAKDSLIFTGQYMEFGFWKKDKFGDLNYTSISAKLTEPMLEDEEFWNIVALGDWVLFQSLDRIYSYNIRTNLFNILEVKSNKAHIFEVDETIYFQNKNLGIYKIENGASKLVIDDASLQDRSVVGMHKEGDTLILILDNAKFIKFLENKAVLWPLDAENQLEGLSIYCTERLNDGSYVLGTISKGIYQISKYGKLLRIINQRKGLNNNTVLSVFQDKDDNLWLGLDNGLSIINMNSPFNEYLDNLGRLGLVYTSKLFHGNLYLGTNQGLFFKPYDADVDFKVINGTDGQVWSLNEIDGTLFCGHNKGTFVVEDDRVTLVSDLPGTWGVKAIDENPNILLQGNFDGLSTLKKVNGSWVFGKKISGFDISSRFFEPLSQNRILVNHEYKGLYELRLDTAYAKVIDYQTHPIMGHGSSLLNYQDRIVYTSLDAAFTKAQDSLFFEPDTILIKLLYQDAGGITSVLMPDKESNRFWCYTKSGLSYAYTGTFNTSLGVNTIPIPKFLRRSLGVSGFENLTRIKDEQYLIGISNGFVMLDIEKTKDLSCSIKMNGISNQTKLENQIKRPVNPGQTQTFNYNQNSISFSFGVPQYDKYNEVFYQYRLTGMFDEWSNWLPDSEITFNNLKYGDYQFEVKAMVGNAIAENVAQYSFIIARPWYLSILAFILYGLGFIFILIVVHRFYKKYYTKKQSRLLDLEKKKLKRKKLKTEKELIQVKNEKLRSEIEAKNRELAVATMSMIKKNEFLNTIKADLTKIENAPAVVSVIKTIDRSINNEDDWKFFKEAFNNADKDFLKKVKKAHENLTPNDLKLCAYLRLNLSSKDIAPLLNISVRSVEVKRYRLRKKLGLPREDSLVKYIMEL